MKGFWFGVIISVTYCVGLYLTVNQLGLNIMTSWNEFGDFLSGAFSPLAFLWLILGYLQQQKELQQNTRALELQASELKNSVDQYKEMVDVARQQLISDRELSLQQQELRELENKPDISVKDANYTMRIGGDLQYEWPIYNDGREARNVLIQFTPSLGRWDKVEFKKLSESSIKLPLNSVKVESIPRELSMTISYESVFGKKYVKVLELHSDQNYRFKVLKETLM